jgi:hypothetical protein
MWYPRKLARTNSLAVLSRCFAIVFLSIAAQTIAIGHCLSADATNSGWYLVDLRDARIEKEHRLTTGNNWQTIYTTTVDVRKNDVLRVRGQVEVTNDFRFPLIGAMRIVSNGKVASPIISQNCTSSFSGHHMPLWCDASVKIESEGFVQVGVQYRAEFSNTTARIKLERGYGHLVVEHYRHFKSLDSAKQAEARGLVQWKTDSIVDSKVYGGTFQKRALAYKLQMNSLAGDIVRLTGQSTAGWIEGEVEMHGQTILINNRVTASPWSTENAARSSQYVPLATDGLHRVNYAGAYHYAVTMHGVRDDEKRPIIAACGHVTAHQFRRLDASDSPMWRMVSTPRIVAPNQISVQTNTGFQSISEHKLQLDKDDVVRVTGMIEVQYPDSYTGGEGIFCKAVSRVLDSDGNVVARSPYWPKYVTRYLKNLPLRTEQTIQAAKAGEYTVQLQLLANREAVATDVPIGKEGSQLIVEHFSLTKPSVKATSATSQ